MAQQRPQAGDEVRIEGDGWKWRGVIQQVGVQVEAVDITRDGSMYPFIADEHRVSMPGRRTVTLTIEIAGEA